MTCDIFFLIVSGLSVVAFVVGWIGGEWYARWKNPIV